MKSRLRILIRIIDFHLVWMLAFVSDARTFAFMLMRVVPRAVRVVLRAAEPSCDFYKPHGPR